MEGEPYKMLTEGICEVFDLVVDIRGVSRKEKPPFAEKLRDPIDLAAGYESVRSPQELAHCVEQCERIHDRKKAHYIILSTASTWTPENSRNLGFNLVCNLLENT